MKNEGMNIMKNTEVVKNKIVTYLQEQHKDEKKQEGTLDLIDAYGKTYEEIYDFVNEKESICSAPSLYNTLYELVKTEQVEKNRFGSFYVLPNYPVQTNQIDPKNKTVVEKWVYSYLTKPVSHEFTFEEFYMEVKELMQNNETKRNEVFEGYFDITLIVHDILQELVNKNILQKTKQENRDVLYFISKQIV